MRRHGDAVHEQLPLAVFDGVGREQVGKQVAEYVAKGLLLAFGQDQSTQPLDA